jgi:hypothetical protein
MLRALGLWMLATVVAARAPEYVGGPETWAGPADDRPGVETSASSAAAPLPFFYDLYTFRGAGGETTIVAAIAVQAGRLRRERWADGGRYRFDVRFVLADTVQRSVFRSIDSVFVSLPYALPRLHLLHTFVEVHAPPSATTLQRVVVTDATRPGVGQLYDSPFPVPDYGGADLMLSDVAFGLPDAQEGWTRRGYTLALLPTSQFPESAFDVYYEIYNLPTGTPYETEIAVAPLDSEGEIVRARFSGESDAGPDGSVAELRRVESALPSGGYRLTVTVTDRLTGRRAERSRLIQVGGRGEGMTLVRALSRVGA